MNQGSSVLGVVDGVDDVPVIWWVDLGVRIAGMSRLCGAWVLDAADRTRTLQALTVSRMTVATAAGQQLLDQHQIATGQVLDVGATLAAVFAVRDELQTAYEQAAATRRNGRALTVPRWPALPKPLNIETANAPAGDPRACRALAIARWFDHLCAVWEAVEEQRLARSYLRSVGGPVARALPVIIQAARPSVVA